MIELNPTQPLPGRAVAAPPQTPLAAMIDHPVAAQAPVVREAAPQNGKSAEADALEKRTRDEVKNAVQQLNDTAKVFNTRVRFEVDEQRDDALRIFIVGEDNKVVRAIPADEILDISQRIQNALGLLFDEKA